MSSYFEYRLCIRTLHDIPIRFISRWNYLSKKVIYKHTSKYSWGSNYRKYRRIILFLLGVDYIYQLYKNISVSSAVMLFVSKWQWYLNKYLKYKIIIAVPCTARCIYSNDEIHWASWYLNEYRNTNAPSYRDGSK